jgi:hypothetical protein
MYWLRTEHACNRAIFGSSPICSQCLSARDVSQACSPGKRLIYSNRLLRKSIAVKFQLESAFRPASKLFISCSVKFQVEPPFRPASKLFISCSVKFQVEPAFRPASRLFISCAVKFQVEPAFRPASRLFISCAVKFQVELAFRPASRLFISCSVKFQVEPAFRPASRLFISCSESASADGTGDAERIFQHRLSPKPLHSAAPYRKVLVGPRGDV